MTVRKSSVGWTKDPFLLKNESSSGTESKIRYSVRVGGRKGKVLQVKKDTFKASLPALECASIMVVVSGEATLEDISESESPMKTPKRSVKRGDIIYIPPERRLRVVAVEEDIEAYRTFSFELGPDHESRTVVPVRESGEEEGQLAERRATRGGEASRRRDPQGLRRSTDVHSGDRRGG